MQNSFCSTEKMDIMQRKMEMQRKFLEEMKPVEWKGDLTMEEVNKHSSRDDLWMIYGNDVYDLTQYVSHHPGGASCFLPPNPKDMTRAFKAVHGHVNIKMYEKLKIGRLVSK